MRTRSPFLINIAVALAVSALLGHGQTINMPTPPLSRRKKVEESEDDWLAEPPNLNLAAYEFKTGFEFNGSILFETEPPSPFARPAKTHKGKKLRRRTY